MSDQEKTIEELESEIPRRAADAVREAYRKTLASGQSVLVSDDAGGVVFRVTSQR